MTAETPHPDTERADAAEARAEMFNAKRLERERLQAIAIAERDEARAEAAEAIRMYDAAEERARTAEAEVERLDGVIVDLMHSASAEATATRVAVARLTATLRTIQGWDCLNPPQAQLLADLPWLRRLVDAALDSAPSGEAT